MNDKVLFSYNDIYGSLVCILFGILFLKIVSKYFIKDAFLYKLFFWGFILRIIGIIVTALFYSYIQIGTDSYVYFTIAKSVSKAISQYNFSEYSKIFYLDFENIPFKIQSLLSNRETWIQFLFIGNKSIVLIAAVISYFTFDSYIGISFFFSLWAYLGIWLIFYTFYKKYPGLANYFYIFIIAYPALWFWTTGVLKDPLCIGSIGVLFFLFFGKIKNINKIVLLVFLGIISIFLLISIKAYLFYIFVFSLLISYIIFWIGKIDARKNPFSVLMLCGILVIGIFYLQSNFHALLVSSVVEGMTNRILETTKFQLDAGGDAVYNLGTIDVSHPLSLFSYLLSAINVSIYRPYLWEAKKITIALSALEGVLAMAGTVYILLRVNFLNLLALFKNNRVLVFSFFFILILAATAGSIAFNFGALSRYKMPLIPFLFSMFIIIIANEKRIKQSK